MFSLVSNVILPLRGVLNFKYLRRAQNWLSVVTRRRKANASQRIQYYTFLFAGDDMRTGAPQKRVMSSTTILFFSETLGTASWR